MTFSRTDILILLLATALVVALSCHFGWLNIDGMNYLLLAKNLAKSGALSLRPDWGMDYWAVFPFGYPLVIAVMHTLLPWVSWLAASKIINGVLLIALAAMAARLLQLPLLLAAALCFTAPWLHNVNETWSENLFVPSLVAAFWGLQRYFATAQLKWLALYFIAAVAGFSARYIGGFYLAAYGLILLMVYRHAPRNQFIAAVLATVAAMSLFATYLFINKSATGYLTGMPRIPSPESVPQLAVIFIQELLETSILPALSALLVIRTFPTRADWATVRPRLREPSSAALILGGLLYFALLFALRAYGRFELFSDRLLMPGITLVMLGIVAAYRVGDVPKHRRHTWLFIGIALLNLGWLYRPIVTQPLSLPYTSGVAYAQAQFRDAGYAALPPGTAVILVYKPFRCWNIEPLELGAEDILVMQMADYAMPYEDFFETLKELKYKNKPPHYVFDFTSIPDMAFLEREMQALRLDAALQQVIRRYFKPNAWVPCPECGLSLAKPSQIP